jgi:uncharacterized protein YjiS (DUF1127 family)
MSINPDGTATHSWRGDSDTPRRNSSKRLSKPLKLADLAMLGLEFSKHLAHRIRAKVERRRLSAMLSAMPDHILKDIGISRSEIDYRVQNGRAERIARSR